MTRKLLALACLGVFAVAACRQEPAEPVAEVAAASAVPPAHPTADLGPSSASPTPENAGFDMKGFAGTFSGTLPCADCPGIDTTLVLDPDGSYTLTEVYQDSADGTFETDGAWTAQADGAQIRLDPDSKSDRNRVYAIVSHERITQLNLAGEPIESGLDYSLQRDNADGD